MLTFYARLGMAALLACLTAPVLAQKTPFDNDPLYWKNRKPDGAYWQQDIHCSIDARIDEKDHRIDGKETLVYWNNSPDTLREIYFHLYQNAFVKGSYLHDLEEEKGLAVRLGEKEAAGQGTLINQISLDYSDGKDPVEKAIKVQTELDNTILKVYLREALKPGDKVTVNIDFKTWYDNGSTRRRMQMYDAWGFMHYNGVQWFPKVCVYDRKFGWETYQHLNKEFYGEFGTYDVSLDFPSNYVVEATGALQNREEVLPKALREKLDMANFKDKAANEAPSIITPYKEGERKVWKYHADRVHDFAFTADPSYRISTAYWKGIECVGIAQEPHAAGWQTSGPYVAKIIKTFSEDIGMYGYPKMVAADARDGMEYPMLTLDGGSDPGYRSLLIHEIGHNWFYGMVGSNETYRAAMDEGFTQFLTAWGMWRIERDRSAMEGRAINVYTIDALNKAELPLNTHSNDFRDALGHEGGYRQVYYKTATMLYNLQYTLGDSLFLAAMQHYFDQWKFAHPYFEDFRGSIINFTNVDLNWFFDQWIETTKTIDYSVGKISKGAGDNIWNITFKRKGDMQMPLDFTVTDRKMQEHSFHIPNTWFVKKTDATVLPKWYGWSKIQPTYTATVSLPDGVKMVQIDTSYRLADSYFPNNYRNKNLSPFEGVKTRFDRGRATPFNRRSYQLFYRPDVWYNPVDGIKVGFHIEGDYMSLVNRIDATVWWNTHVLQDDRYVPFESEGTYERFAPVNYTASFATPLTRRFPKLEIQLHSRFLDGLWLHRGGFALKANDNNRLQLFAQTFYRPNADALAYLIYPQEWSSVGGDRPNSSLNFAWNHSYGYKRGAGNYTLSLRAPFLAGNRADALDYAYAQIEAINTNKVGKLEVRTRLFGRFGTGTNLPYESMLWAAGANPEELMENKFTRTKGIVPEAENWSGISRYETGHFQQGGGLNLRGYAGYILADERNGEVLLGYKSRSGISGSAEIDYDQFINLKPKLFRNWLHIDAYLFGDAGITQLSRYVLPDFTRIAPTTMWSDLRADAGAGFAFTVKQWGRFSKARPLTLRVDLPLFLNRPPYANPDYFRFRYVLGVNRSF